MQQYFLDHDCIAIDIPVFFMSPYLFHLQFVYFMLLRNNYMFL